MKNKKVFSLFFITAILLIILSYAYKLLDKENTLNGTVTSPEPTSSPIQNVLSQMKQVSYNNQTYSYASFLSKSYHKLHLYPNFDQRLTATELKATNNCTVLINAGFYSKDNRPLGWFYTQGSLINRSIQSSLFNGYLCLSENGKYTISTSPTETMIVWGLQTGPILMQNSQPLGLKIRDDETARRSLAAITNDNQIFLAIVAGPSSSLSGPKLADLPQILKQIALAEGLEFTSAINLDGGTASAFLSGEISLKEITWIGSFFCIQ
jgi:uncharacterized protein YigE (DUF2233 family)